MVAERSVFVQGVDEDSATLAAIRAIRRLLIAGPPKPKDGLYYLV